MKILVVDDEWTIREMIADFLTGFGEVNMAADGLEALEMIKEAGGFDAVFTDQTMPRLCGADLVREIKKIFPKTYVVLASGDQREELLRKGKEAGADRILIKPFPFEELETAIKEAAAKM